MIILWIRLNNNLKKLILFSNSNRQKILKKEWIFSFRISPCIWNLLHQLLWKKIRLRSMIWLNNLPIFASLITTISLSLLFQAPLTLRPLGSGSTNNKINWTLFPKCSQIVKNLILIKKIGSKKEIKQRPILVSEVFFGKYK